MPSLNEWENLVEFQRYLKWRVWAIGLDPRVRVRFSASDIVAETFVRAVATPNECQSKTREGRLAWLEKIQDHVLIDKWRECRRDKCDAHKEVQFIRHLGQYSSAAWERSLSASGLGPAEEAAQKELLMRVLQALDELPRQEQEVLTLVLLRGCSVTEAAQALEITRGSASGFYTRGLARLRQELKGLHGENP